MEQARISSQHATHEARSARTHAKSAAQQDGAQAADQSGFSSLLAALGGVGLAEMDDLLGDASSATDTSGAAVLAQDPAAMASLQSGLLPDATLAQRLAALAAGTAKVAGSSAGVGDVAGGSAGNGASRWSWGSEKASLESLVGQTAMMDGAAEAASINGAPALGAAAPFRGGAGRFQSTVPTTGLDTSGQGAVASALRGAIKGDKKGLAQDAGLPLASTVTAVLDRRDSVAGGGATALARGMEAAASLPTGMGAALGGDAASAGGRFSGRGGESSGSGAAPTPAGVGETGPELKGPEAFALEGGAASADPSQMGAEEQIAEQVAYWVHQKTQNAELTLDRDGQPVGVTVSLTGNEAHITSRSDQAHTRDMLDSSIAQLRDLLGNEGLQLSGVTVGTAGDNAARDGGGNQGGARQGARQAAVSSVAPAGSAGRAQQVTDRAVDIFV